MSKHNGGLIEEVAEYLLGILSIRSYDLVVCIERRGLVLYTDTLSITSISIPFYSEKALDRLSVKKKKILLFDDTINTGSHAKEIKAQLLSNGAIRVDIAAYAKVKTCMLETLETKYLLEYDEFKKIRNNISQHMTKRLIPPDADHIYILGRLRNPLKLEQIKSICDEFGEAYYPEKIHYPYKIGIYAKQILDWRSLDLPLYVDDMPSWKIRINITLY